MIRSALATPAPSTSATRRALASARFSGSLTRFVEQFRGPIQRRLHELHLAILQGHGETAQGAPGGDVAAHHAGADDMHMADAMLLAAESLEPVLQEENAHQVACGRRLRQFDDGAGLGLEGCVDRMPPLRCQVEISANGAG